MLEKGKDEDLDRMSRIEAAANPDSSVKFNPPSDVDRDRAKRAYDMIQTKLTKRDLNSDNLFEDLISEKAYELDRFVNDDAPKSLKDDLLEHSMNL